MIVSLMQGVVVWEADCCWPGAEPSAYCLSSSSHRARRSWRSWLGRRRFLAGAGVLGTQVTFAFIQLEQGELRSHLILRCWQRTQARILDCLCGAAGDTDVDMSGLRMSHMPDRARLCKENREGNVDVARSEQVKPAVCSLLSSTVMVSGALYSNGKGILGKGRKSGREVKQSGWRR